MDWLAQNWVWILVLGAFIGMHLFGHGGHDGHGGCGGHGGRHGDENKSPTDAEQAGKNRPQGHQH